MIKKIPIKGISRDPSGQISSDGFCSESLNVQLDMGEVAPAISPRRVKDAGGNDVSVEGDILFLHKGIGYENLIYRDGKSLLYVAVIGDPSSGVVYGGLSSDEVVNDITAIGNTVILSTDKDMYYILWKDGAYRFLGHQIPIPAIHFRMDSLDGLRSEPAADINSGDYDCGFAKSGDDEAPIFPHDTIGDVAEYGFSAKKYVFDRDFEKGFWNEFMDVTWGEIDKQVNEQARNGRAVFPLFVRYAVRLYDGTCYAQSIPILLGAEINKYIDVKAAIMQLFFTGSGEESLSVTTANIFVEVAKSYGISMRVASAGIFDGWEDIVTGVDVFVSPQLGPVQRDAAKFQMEYKEKDTAAISALKTGYLVSEFYVDPYYTVENQEKLVLNYQDTYLARSFALDEFKELPSDYRLDVDFSSDHIMAQEALKETPQSMHHTVGSRLFNYNKRLMMAGVEQSVHPGYQFLPSVRWDLHDDYVQRWRFVYHIRGNGGEANVICRDMDGNAYISEQSAAIISESATLYDERPVAWLSYPDSRCYQVDLYAIGNGQTTPYASFKMTPFDRADVAYAFFGFGGLIVPTSLTDALPTSENPKMEMPDTLVVSKSNNPFVFPAEDMVTFTAGDILNLAVANVPLSEGQAGQFPLYVFTDEGVFAMTVNTDGSLRTSHNVSRDVLISKDAVIGIEQGVFFAAARGLLLLQGSRITKVSDVMDGIPQEMEGELLDDIQWRFLGGMTVDEPKAFREYLDGCFLAYDYANTRILVLNPACEAQYVYKFDTQSWHRLQTGFGYPVRALNSFPEAQVVMKGGRRQSLLDFSVLAENADAEPMHGIVYTRDLDIDAADIYKTVHRLKVRGRFADGHVKWQLQGSNDGRNYITIHSLRGPSWKWFRIVLVTMLDKDERISYVELDYSPRFMDKIR